LPSAITGRYAAASFAGCQPNATNEPRAAATE
jgi:hypothetical protein